ncbi:MAG TPA: PEP-CTERM sorting domain-containing protein [Bryobacteraceae bacterium]|nr:PEP-CTERM sorting domain-containing protein [Bryobacteraceae bacterium]
MHSPSSRWPVVRLIVGAAILSVALSVPARAAPIADCNASFTTCYIPENTLLQLPDGDLAIAGDVLLFESDGTTISDVFRIFNNFVNTGQGTGLGDLVELYSADDVALPTSFSANAVAIFEDPSGITSYTNNGTTYVLGAPEPRSVALLGLAGAVFMVLRRKRARTIRDI